MLIVGTRRTSKSYKLVKEAERTGATILCANESNRKEINHIALHNGFKIKQPVLFSEINLDKYEDIIIDNLDLFAMHMLRNKNILSSSVGVNLGQINILDTNRSYEEYYKKDLNSKIKSDYLLADWSSL